MGKKKKRNLSYNSIQTKILIDLTRENLTVEISLPLIFTINFFVRLWISSEILEYIEIFVEPLFFLADDLFLLFLALQKDRIHIIPLVNFDLLETEIEKVLLPEILYLLISVDLRQSLGDLIFFILVIDCFLVDIDEALRNFERVFHFRPSYPGRALSSSIHQDTLLELPVLIDVEDIWVF